MSKGKDARGDHTTGGKDKAPTKGVRDQNKASEKSRPAVRTMKGILHSQKHRTN